MPQTKVKKILKVVRKKENQKKEHQPTQPAYKRNLDPLDNLLKYIANKCIKKKWYRQGSVYHNFTYREIKLFNEIWGLDEKDYLVDGWAFLDKDEDLRNGDKFSGMIRLYSRDCCNPKWVFAVDKNNYFTIDEC